MEGFTDEAKRVLALAGDEARSLCYNVINSGHLLLGLIIEGSAADTLRAAGVEAAPIRDLVGKGPYRESWTAAADSPNRTGGLPADAEALRALDKASILAEQFDQTYVGHLHILLALVQTTRGAARRVFLSLGTDLERLAGELQQQLRAGAQQARPPAQDGLAALPSSTFVQMSPPKMSPPILPVLPALGQFGRNLTQAAREGRLDPVTGREREIERVMQVLSRHAVSSPVLVGASGIGKTTVVHGLAARMARGNVPPAFAGKELFVVDPAEVARTASTQDDLDWRLAQILTESPVRGDVILFIENLQQGAGQRLHFWPLLGSALLRREAQIIGAATAEDYATLPYVERELVPVHVAELTVSHTVEILSSLRHRYADHHGIGISDAALAAAARLAADQLPDRPLPTKAIDLLDEAASLAAMRGLPELDEALIVETVAIMLGVQAEPASAPPRFAPAAMTDDDREIWGMA